jgi:hypothetical protein
MWSIIGNVAATVTIATAIGVPVVSYFTSQSPSSQLVADIRPMAFRLPVTRDQIWKLAYPDKPKPENAEVLALLKEINLATGLVEIDLHNNGELPISGIHVNVDRGLVYAIGKLGGMDDPSVLRSDKSGITLDSLTQGSSITVYVWTDEPPDYYRNEPTYIDLGKNFNISYSQGVARKNIYTEGSLFSLWLDRNWLLVWVSLCMILFVLPRFLKVLQRPILGINLGISLLGTNRATHSEPPNQQK